MCYLYFVPQQSETLSRLGGIACKEADMKVYEFDARLELKQVRQTLRGIHQITGRPPDELRLYERRYMRHPCRDMHSAALADVLDALLGYDIVLCGDYHTYSRAQATFLKILKRMWKAGNVVLVLECLLSEYSGLMGVFLGGEIGEDVLFRELEWEETWGFPRGGYARIFKFARDKGIAVRSAGRRRKDEEESLGLRNKDIIMAQAVVRALEEFQSSRVLVMAGDSHLARSHLPRDLMHVLARKRRADKKTLAVLQDHPAMFRFLATNGGVPEAVFLGEDACCVFNGLLSQKLESYLRWLSSERRRTE